MTHEDEAEFVRLADPYRQELLAHCYRMLGSLHDAEDLVQETYLRAWRGYDGFAGRSSLRFWLYSIATRACLSALRHRSRRFLPAGLGVAADDPDAPHGPALPEATWVQPLPGPAPDDPAAVVATRGSVRLALVVALQTLPPKQRAALILRDVLGWRAAEVADLLGVTPVAVNSALQRARAQLEGITEDDVAEGAHDALLDRYAKAFDNADVETLVRLLHEDVTLEMPPEPFWFAGRERVGRFLGRNVLTGPGLFRLLPVTANGQPAAATYWRPADGLFHAHAIQVLTVAREQVTRIVVFRQPTLFPSFGLPMTATPVPPGSR